jgi:hypothetical protein
MIAFLSRLFAIKREPTVKEMTVEYRKCATLLLIAALTVASIEQSKAGNFAPTPLAASTSSSVGAIAWISGTIIGIATFLGIYDITRRTSCVGDFMHLGGPGFDRTITPNDNVLTPPVCNCAEANRPTQAHLIRSWKRACRAGS